MINIHHVRPDNNCSEKKARENEDKNLKTANNNMHSAFAVEIRENTLELIQQCEDREINEEVETIEERNEIGNPGILPTCFSEIKKIPLLTSEEERELGKQIQEGDEETRRIAIQKIMEGNLRLVFWVAKKYKQPYFFLEDLFQEGNVGLRKAAEKFDPTKGVKFATYAVWWIRQAINGAIWNKGRFIRLPSHQEARISKLETTKKRLGNKLYYEPDAHDLAEATGISVKECETILSTPKEVELRGVNRVEIMESAVTIKKAHARSKAPERFRKTLMKKIEEAVGQLEEEHQAIIKMHFGICGEKKYKLREIPIELVRRGLRKNTISRERIRQMEEEAIEVLKTLAKPS